MTRYAQQLTPASAGTSSLIGDTPTVGAAWEAVASAYAGSTWFKFDGTTSWGPTDWAHARIPTNSGNADGYVEATFTLAADDWIMIVFGRCQASDQRYQLTLSGSSGNAWISLETAAGAFPSTVVATTTHGVASSNRGTHTIRLTFTGTAFEGSLDGAAAFISGTNATLSAVGYAGVGARGGNFVSMDAQDTTSAAPVITGPLAGGGRTHSTLTQGRLAP